jgi:uncharacterized Zn finger protein (UPF0148 family)
MSQNQSKLSCSLCHSYLFEEDDVVYCPVCGAPHHRECYNSIGHCALESAHGTDMQYDKLKYRQQQESKEEPPKTDDQTETTWNSGFNPNFEGPMFFDLLGGVPKDYLIDDDVTAEETAKFVMSNTMRYIPKFAKLSKSKRVSWNFLAFLFPCGWFLSRKMYKNGLIAGLLSIISNLLSLPLLKTMENLGITDSVSYYDMIQRMMDNLPNINSTVIFVALIGSWISIAISLICALFGDYLYKSHVVKTIKKIKSESSDINFDYRKKGGVNIILFLLGTMAVNYIPSIISVFIG